MNQNAVAAPHNQTHDKEHYPIYAGQVLGGGAHRSVGRLYYLLIDRGYSIDNSTKEVLHAYSFKLTVRYTFLKLVMVTPEMINLPEGGNLQAIEIEAKQFGLGLLPMDTAPFLILQLRSGQLAADPSIVVASEAVMLSGNPYIFEVNNFQLRVISGAPTAHFKKDQKLLLRRL